MVNDVPGKLYNKSKNENCGANGDFVLSGSDLIEYTFHMKNEIVNLPGNELPLKGCC